VATLTQRSESWGGTLELWSSRTLRHGDRRVTTSRSVVSPMQSSSVAAAMTEELATTVVTSTKATTKMRRRWPDNNFWPVVLHPSILFNSW